MAQKDKKIPSITWEDIVLEAMVALTGGRNDIPVPADAMYSWIEATQYITDRGREPDGGWADGRYPSYRASLQLRWQRMVNDNLLVRVDTGIYRLAESQMESKGALWQTMVQVDAQVKQPNIIRTETRRIQRNQKLRDLLINYYESRCQVCGADQRYSIPLLTPNRYYVEVHHVSGLAETIYLQQQGQRTGLKVNGLENLTVLCPHHHAVLHHHYPSYNFDRPSLCWRTAGGQQLNLQTITTEHATLMQNADVT